MDYLTSIVIMAVLVLFSAYFSATETAFSSLNRARLKAEADRGDKRSAEVLKLVSDFDKLLSTLLIGNNIVNIAASSIGTVTFIRLLNDSDKGASVSTVVVTVVVLIFGEITPKSVAKEAPESFARFSAPLLPSRRKIRQKQSGKNWKNMQTVMKSENGSGRNRRRQYIV